MSQPPEIPLAVTTTFTEAGLDVSVADKELDRLLVWAGRFAGNAAEPTEVLWTSESHPVRVDQVHLGARLHVPSSLMHGCNRFSDCQIVLQVVRFGPVVRGTTSVAAMSEAKRVIYSASKSER